MVFFSFLNLNFLQEKKLILWGRGRVGWHKEIMSKEMTERFDKWIKENVIDGIWESILMNCVYNKIKVQFFNLVIGYTTSRFIWTSCKSVQKQWISINWIDQRLTGWYYRNPWRQEYITILKMFSKWNASIRCSCLIMYLANDWFHFDSEFTARPGI